MLKNIFVIAATLTLHCHAQNLPYAAVDLIDQSNAQIDQGCNEAKEFIKKNITAFISLSKDRRFDEAYSVWKKLCCHYFTRDIELKETIKQTSNESIRSYADAQKTALSAFMAQELQQSSELLQTFIANGMQAQFLSPQDRFITQRILTESLSKASHFSQPIKDALQTLATHTSQNFTALQTKAAVAAPSEELRVFTANIICFPSILTYYYGGIAPWKTRIDKLAAVFKQTDAHIVCLQEVWDPEAMEALFERLKESYSFFVFDAGDPYSTLDPENMGYCSGLFVASRIPFDEVSFYPYVRTFPAKKGVKRGALLVKMTINGEKVTCLSTHLQHGTDENAEMIRLEQFARCHDLLQQAVDEGKENQSWGFLLGDINIDAFSKEFEQSQMQQLFLVPYIERQIKVTPANATATNYFNDLVYAPLDQRRKIVPFYELLDYCICLKTAPKPSTCKKVALFDVDKPMEALSDHQGLLTTWSLKDRR